MMALPRPISPTDAKIGERVMCKTPLGSRPSGSSGFSTMPRLAALARSAGGRNQLKLPGACLPASAWVKTKVPSKRKGPPIRRRGYAGGLGGDRRHRRKYVAHKGTKVPSAAKEYLERNCSSPPAILTSCSRTG